MVSRKVRDLVSLYHDERKYRTELIEKERKTMQEILRQAQSSQMKNTSDEEDSGRDGDDLAVKEEDHEVPVPVLQSEADHSEQEIRDFACWLRSISQCLSNKISDDKIIIPVNREQREFKADLCTAGRGGRDP